MAKLVARVIILPHLVTRTLPVLMLSLSFILISTLFLITPYLVTGGQSRSESAGGICGRFIAFKFQMRLCEDKKNRQGAGHCQCWLRFDRR